MSRRNAEDDILFETDNLFLARARRGLEICLTGATHSIVVGHPKDVESGKRAMLRMERYIGNLRAMHRHYA